MAGYLEMVFPYQKKNLSMFPTTASYREKEKEKLKKFCISAQVDTVLSVLPSALLSYFNLKVPLHQTIAPCTSMINFPEKGILIKFVRVTCMYIIL